MPENTRSSELGFVGPARNPAPGASSFWRSAAQCLLGGGAIALLTLVCFRFGVSLTIASLLCLTVVVLFSVLDASIAWIFVSVLSVLCLNYFFTPPLFSLRVADAQDIVSLLVFLGIALLIRRLMARRKRAEEALHRANDELRDEIVERQHAAEALQKTQAELAHVSRVLTLGELTASIAHEVNQPLAAVVTNAQAALRWLSLEKPRLDEVRTGVERIVRDGNRASEVIQRVRALAKMTEPQTVALNINDIIREAISLQQREMLSRGVLLRTELAPALPPVVGDRVQLQQVVINLVMNALEAMEPITDRPREILIRSQRHEPGQVVVAFRDSGIGIDSQNAEDLFKAPPSRTAWE